MVAKGVDISHVCSEVTLVSSEIKKFGFVIEGKNRGCISVDNSIPPPLGLMGSHRGNMGYYTSVEGRGEAISGPMKSSSGWKGSKVDLNPDLKSLFRI